MTILDYLTASIVVDGMPCLEYAIEVPAVANSEVIDLEKPRLGKLRPLSGKQDANRFEKCLEAVGGAHFEVKTGVYPGFDFGSGETVAVQIYLNGVYAEGVLHQEGDFDHVDGFRFMTCRGAGLDNRNVVQRFRFANIIMHQRITARYSSLADSSRGEDLPEDDIEGLKSQHKDLGTIEVKRSRLSTGNGSLIGQYSRNGSQGKAICMAASFGDTKTMNYYYKFSIEYTDRLPVATVLCKCRSKNQEGLQSLLIVPRSPVLIPLELRPVEELSLDEAWELIRRQQEAAEATILRIKHEETEANLSKLRSLKHHKTVDVGSNSNEVEVVASRSKRQRLLPTAEDEVIDLSD